MGLQKLRRAVRRLQRVSRCLLIAMRGTRRLRQGSAGRQEHVCKLTFDGHPLHKGNPCSTCLCQACTHLASKPEVVCLSPLTGHEELGANEVTADDGSLRPLTSPARSRQDMGPVGMSAAGCSLRGQSSRSARSLPAGCLSPCLNKYCWLQRSEKALHTALRSNA